MPQAKKVKKDLDEAVRKIVNKYWIRRKAQGLPPTDVQKFFLQLCTQYPGGLPIDKVAEYHWGSLGGLFTRRLVTWQVRGGVTYLVRREENEPKSKN